MSILSLALDTPSLASHYEHVSRERQFKAGQVLVEKLRIERGQHVLDVGSGTGLLAEHVAGIVGDTGSVVGLDPLPLRIDIALEKERHNLHFSVGDAYDLGSFDTDTFDAVYLNAVFHWLPEKTEPLRQFYRVLKPGGRLGISTGSKDHISPLQQIRRAVLARDLYRSYPESGAGFPNRVGRDELEALLEQAGFERVSVEVTPHVQFQPTPAAAVEFAQASSFGNFLSHLPPELGRSARAEIEAELAGLTTSEGIRQESARLIAIASKPRAA
jgi:ubiquinone/menaquinone biosynthesis C-methylase UbiE